MPLNGILQLAMGLICWATRESRPLMLKCQEGTYTIKWADAESREGGFNWREKGRSKQGYDPRS